MATISSWNPFGVALDITATADTVTRTSATQYTVKINASWETHYSGAQTNYGMKVTSGGATAYIPKFTGDKISSSSGTLTGTYSINGNGSQTKTVTVVFENYNDLDDSETKNVTFDVTVPAWTSYTVSYNANGGSGAPSSQTKWKDQTLTLSSTKPTRTGYTFLGWSTSNTATSATYSSSGSYTVNSAATLYAVWSENALTVNYYSNYATSAFDDALNTVGADKNVKVWTYDFYYDNDYSTYGLANYSNSSGSVYMTRTGYTGTKYWGTSTSGGTLIHEDTGYSTGQSLAEALGKDLANGNASINLYAQWSENSLTINYYSNYADYGTFNGEVLDVNENSNVVAYSHKYYYDNAYSDGLYNIQNSEKLYLSRTGYKSTLHWGTSVNGGILIDQYTTFDTGQALAEALGKDISNGNASIDIYAQWTPNILTMKFNVNGGKVKSDKYYVDNDLINVISSSSVLEDEWEYNNGHTNGLYNANTLGLYREGYKFVGWKVGSSGSIVFDQDDASIIPTDLASDLTTGDRTITLYAVWEISGVVYIDNGVALEPYLIYIDNGSSWDLYFAYIDDGVTWTIIS